MNFNDEQRNIWISFGVISGVGFCFSIIHTWKWFSRSSKDVVDLQTISHFAFHLLGIIGSISVIVVSGFSAYWLFINKKNFDFSEMSTPSGLIEPLKILLIIAFVFKTLDIFYLIGQQTDATVFFMDWERPKIGSQDTVSVWRTYFVANEYNEIQTFRRINVPFQLFFILFFLQGLNFEQMSEAQNQIELFSRSTNETVTYDPIFRTGLGFVIFLGTGLVQYLTMTIFYQRIFEDKIINFIDLCSVANISVFIFDNGCHGYYIHGRSPHGITDVNMKDLLMNFHREQAGKCSQRGLPLTSSDQLFIVRSSRTFRSQYDSLIENYYRYTMSRQARHDKEQQTDVLLESYQNLNGFLCSFIDQSLVGHIYFIRNRYLLEKIFDHEFQLASRSMPLGPTENLLLIDKERSFTNIFFYGNERSLFLWNLSTFLFVDFFATNFVLSAVITFITNRFIVGLRNSFGRRNLSRKTLIPKNFLI